MRALFGLYMVSHCYLCSQISAFAFSFSKCEFGEKWKLAKLCGRDGRMVLEASPRMAERIRFSLAAVDVSDILDGGDIVRDGAHVEGPQIHP